MQLAWSRWPISRSITWHAVPIETTCNTRDTVISRELVGTWALARGSAPRARHEVAPASPPRGAWGVAAVRTLAVRIRRDCCSVGDLLCRACSAKRGRRGSTEAGKRGGEVAYTRCAHAEGGVNLHRPSASSFERDPVLHPGFFASSAGHLTILMSHFFRRYGGRLEIVHGFLHHSPPS